MTKKTQGTTQKKLGNVVSQKITRRVRLLFYGGARKIGDNASFKFAAENVSNDYINKFPNDTIFFSFTDSAKTIIDAINNQRKGKIASLDLFFHGSKWGLYIYKGSSMNKELLQSDINDKNLNAGLYGGRITGLTGTDDNEEQRTIYDIDFSRFIENAAVIEIHGCESGGELFMINSIAKNLSEELRNGYVIGHITKANPNINGTTINKEQDYRHGERTIWKNGEIIKTTTKQKWLDPKDFSNETS
jgi:hypothetical protein